MNFFGSFLPVSLAKPFKDTLLAELPGTIHLTDRKDLLLTVREILVDYASNRNVYRGGERESIQDHARKLVVDLLMNNRENEKKKTRKDLIAMDQLSQG